MNPSLEGNDYAEIYAEARARYYEGKRVGWDNWADIEDAAHKFALLTLCDTIIKRKQRECGFTVP